jgi:LysR family transcriptional regulator, hydrogen peroxide-inducible genes activator
METHQVQYFLALCKEKHFGRAARRCGIAQPSLTKAIRKLERGLGGLLFYRSPTVELTELARALQPYLRRIVRNVEGARREATRLNGVAISSSDQFRSARSDAISVT